MAIKVIIDSTTDMPASMDGKYTVIPLTVSFGSEEYLDGVTITKDEFYTKLVESDELPRTSQASPAAFEKSLKEATANGDSVIVITLSSKLSGTYQSAVIAAQDFDNVYVIDSENVALGTGILVEYAIRCIEEGRTVEEIVDALEERKSHIRLVARLDTLKFLQKGGRISKTAAIAGNVLNIKPVITIDDGQVAMLGKARGSKKANNFLNEEVKKTGVDYFLPVMLAYSGCSDELLKQYINDSKALWKDKLERLDITQLGTVVGTHAGPGAIAVAYFDD